MARSPSPQKGPKSTQPPRSDSFRQEDLKGVEAECGFVGLCESSPAGLVDEEGGESHGRVEERPDHREHPPRRRPTRLLLLLLLQSQEAGRVGLAIQPLRHPGNPNGCLSLFPNFPHPPRSFASSHGDPF